MSTGLLPGSDYVAPVSADNFGLGSIAAPFLADRLAREATVGVLSHHAGFFATSEREIAFDRWLRTKRPDVRPAGRKFDSIQSAGQDTLAPVGAGPDLAGLFFVVIGTARQHSR